MWSGLASSRCKAANDKRLTNAELVERLYADHNLTPAISDDLLPELSSLWNQRYAYGNRIIADGKSVNIDPNTRVLSGLRTDAGLVLMVSIRNINLTERFSSMVENGYEYLYCAGSRSILKYFKCLLWRNADWIGYTEQQIFIRVARDLPPVARVFRWYRIA